MTSTRMRNWHRKTVAMVVVAAIALLLPAALISCKSGTGGAPSGGGGEPGSGIPGAILLQTDITVSQPVSVFYQTPTSATNLRAFRVAASSSDGLSAVEIGEETILAPPPDLLPGEGQSFVFETEGVPIGPYFVGVRYLVNGIETRIRSDFTITVSGIPVPIFELPNSNRVVFGDQTVNIRVTVGDQQNPVNWRLFYIEVDADTDGVPSDELGVTIEEGTRNIVSTFWRVLGVPPDRYKLGISVTDYGKSIPDTVADDREDRILTVYNDRESGTPYVITVSDVPLSGRAPQITVTDPEDTEFAGFGVDQIVVVYEAQIFEPEPDEERVDLFYDLDTDINGNEVLFDTTDNIDETVALFDTTDLPEDTYFILGTVYDGVNEPVSSYAPGEVIVSRVPALKVTEPSAQLSYRPGQDIQIRWKSNLPTSLAAVVDVLARRVRTDGTPTGQPDILVERIVGTDSLSRTSAIWVPADNQKGRFRMVVKIVTDAADVGTLEDASDTSIVVSTTPTIWWLGDLLESDDPSFQGAVFQGHQFEDNAGSSIVGGEDFDDDGFPDFVIGARYAKPQFVNPSGKGIGEAYLIRGQRDEYLGVFNLNNVSTPGEDGLPGMVFTGILTWTNDTMFGDGLPTDDTYGLASMNLVGDMDGDGVGELIFGFPWVINDYDLLRRAIVPGTPKGSGLLGSGPMGAQFQAGGVVIVSSNNPGITGGGSDEAGTRLRLEQVGQTYSDSRVINDSELCEVNTTFEGWTRDDYTYVTDGECLEADSETGAFPFGEVTRANYWGCRLDFESLNDGVWDVLTSPRFNFGFTYSLALPFSFQYDSLSGLMLPVFSDVPCIEDFINLDTGQLRRNCPRCAGDGSWWDGSWLPGPADAPLPPFDSAACEACDAFAVYDPGVGIERDGCTFISLGGTVPDDSPFVFPPCDGPIGYKASFFDAIGPIAQPVGVSGGPVITVNEATPLATTIDPPVWGTGYLRADREMQAPFGCRIIGRPTLVETTACADGHSQLGLFGASITESGDEIIISAPFWSAARATLYAPPPFQFASMAEDLPDTTAVPNGTVIDQAGVAYLITKANYWLPDFEGAPARPKPCMYMAGGGGFRTVAPSEAWDSSFVEIAFLASGGAGKGGGLPIVGREQERIQNLVGIPDFNDDRRADVAIGAPLAGSNDGAAYVVFRRAKSLEGDYILDKLALSPTDPERLAGIFVTGRPSDASLFGDSVAGGRQFETGDDVKLFDFDSNGVSDIVVGAPNATDDSGNRVGEVWIIFSERTLTTPTNGKPILTLLSEKRAARIRGVEPNGQFGFTVANIGDIDNDGFDDLAIAAPNAPPRFDPNINDSNESLTAAGLDRDDDGGAPDDVSGPKGFADSRVDANDELQKAGLVYVIFGGLRSQDFAKFSSSGVYDVDISKLGTDELPGFILVGYRGNRWDSAPPTGQPPESLPTPTHYGDFLGGGFAGDTSMGGIEAKNHPMPPDCDPSRTGPEDKGRPLSVAGIGDVNGDGRDDFIVGSILADPRVDPQTGFGIVNAGEAYLVYGFKR